MSEKTKKTLIRIEDVSKEFQIDGGTVRALEGVDLQFEEGEFISIVGASGCGKSTLLRMMAGLEKPTEGKIFLEGQEVEKPSIKIGMVFQRALLFPWLTVKRNVEFGISQKLDAKERERRVQEHIELVGLSSFENALPRQLSGGMQQRASIARGLINNPRVLLLDEPFGALDAITKINMQNEVLRIWQAEKKTMILVTHDIDEAIYLGDRVVVMSSRPGKVRKVIGVKMPRPRDRNSSEFSRVRREIYREFFEDTDFEGNVEYYI